MLMVRRVNMGLSIAGEGGNRKALALAGAFTAGYVAAGPGFR